MVLVLLILRHLKCCYQMTPHHHVVLIDVGMTKRRMEWMERDHHDDEHEVCDNR
jgi:hypothetical protein